MNSEKPMKSESCTLRHLGQLEPNWGNAACWKLDLCSHSTNFEESHLSQVGPEPSAPELHLGLCTDF
jgi:hypothetical protein